VVDYGSATRPGRNAFALNRNAPAGANLNLNVNGVEVSAEGNQWEHCGTGATCDVEQVLAEDIRLAEGTRVLLGEPSAPRAGAPSLTRVSPPRPRRGDVVRVFGVNFNAIDGAACAGDTGPADGSCSIRNPAVQERNRQTNATRIRIASRDGEVLETLYPDAVTPTMVAFRMPFDCFAPLTVRVAKRGADGDRLEAGIELCDPAGCQGQAVGTPCDDGTACTVDDRCHDAGRTPACRGEPIPCPGPCLGCDPRAGCVPQPASTRCEDGDVCTAGDRCSGVDGTCLSGRPRACDDDNSCTADACVPGVGCINTPRASRCNDGNLCTSFDVCEAGVCAGTPVSCDDGDVCNGQETCNSALGCVRGEPLPCADEATCVPDGVTCSLETLRLALGEAPALRCTGRCRCKLEGALERVGRLIASGTQAGAGRACPRRLRAAARRAVSLHRRVVRLAARGCIAPIERAERVRGEAGRLLRRATMLAKGFCTRG
jgi:hypothetical protein